jgi:hypothetical protein
VWGRGVYCFPGSYKDMLSLGQVWHPLASKTAPAVPFTMGS